MTEKANKTVDCKKKGKREEVKEIEELGEAELTEEIEDVVQTEVVVG